MGSKRDIGWLIFLLGALLFGALAFVYFFGGNANTDEVRQRSVPSQNISPPAENKSDNPVRIEENFNGPAVTYRGGLFIPSRIVLAPEQGNESCVLRIINESEEELVVRVSPYSPEDARGFAYTPIPAGKTLVIDPRYGLTDISFHNRLHPEHEFQVLLDKGCME